MKEQLESIHTQLGHLRLAVGDLFPGPQDTEKDELFYYSLCALIDEIVIIQAQVKELQDAQSNS